MIALVLSFALCASPQGDIAFLSAVDREARRACVLKVASRAVTQVGPGHADGPPRWSPDGAWLAFDTRTEQGRGVYLVGAEGSQGRYLTHGAAWNSDPAWFPDGNRLAYTAGRGAQGQIAVYDLATDTETVWGAGHPGLMRPVFLPGGSFVAVIASREQSNWQESPLWFDHALPEEGILTAIGLVGEPGQWSTDLFLVSEHEAFPLPQWVLPSGGAYNEWSAAPGPRGRAIAFDSDDGGDREVFVLAEKGAYDVSNHHSADWNPVWSPDGKWIAFESFRSGRRGIYRVHRDTIRIFPVAVTEHAANWAPTWSPDGKWIAHVSDRDGEAGLFLTDFRGKKSEALTGPATLAYAPAWRPAGSR